MIIKYSGYFTKTRKLENACLRAAQIFAPQILGRKNLPKIKELRIIFRKNKIYNWEHGYGWLFKNGIARIYVPKLFRSYHRGAWLVLHELAHLRQIVEKRLIANNINKLMKYGKARDRMKTYNKFKCITTNRKVKQFPWEEEVWRMTEKEHGSKLNIPKSIRHWY